MSTETAPDGARCPTEPSRADLVSRFFVPTDPHPRRFLYDLPATWWSRGYEYAWAASFARPGTTVLDAGAGIPHPFKFYLAGVADAVYAVDWDPRIVDRDEILRETARDAGAEAAAVVAGLDWARLHNEQASLTALPYGDGKFDTVFCVSTWEHLSAGDQVQAFAEMARTLKPGGELVITTDVPPSKPALLQVRAAATGLAFRGPTDFRMPEGGVMRSPWGPMACFRAVFHRPTTPPVGRQARVSREGA